MSGLSAERVRELVGEMRAQADVIVGGRTQYGYRAAASLLERALAERGEQDITAGPLRDCVRCGWRGHVPVGFEGEYVCPKCADTPLADMTARLMANDLPFGEMPKDMQEAMRAAWNGQRGDESTIEVLLDQNIWKRTAPSWTPASVYRVASNPAPASMGEQDDPFRFLYEGNMTKHATDTNSAHSFTEGSESTMGDSQGRMCKAVRAGNDSITGGVTPYRECTGSVIVSMGDVFADQCCVCGNRGEWGIASQHGPGGCREAVETGNVYCEEHLPQNSDLARSDTNTAERG